MSSAQPFARPGGARPERSEESGRGPVVPVPVDSIHRITGAHPFEDSEPNAQSGAAQDYAKDGMMIYRVFPRPMYTKYPSTKTQNTASAIRMHVIRAAE